MKILFVLLITLFSSFTYAYKINEVKVDVASKIENNISIELVFNKKYFLFEKEFKRVYLNSGLLSNSIQLEQTVNISSIDYNIHWSSTNNVDNLDQQSVKLSGKIKLDGKSSFEGSKIKNDRINFSINHKIKTNIKCDNIFNIFAPAKRQLTIDLSNFASMAQCHGEDLKHYTLEGVQKRDLESSSNFFSLNDDINLGKDFANKFNIENSHLLFPIDHPVTLYMQAQMEKIAAVSDMPFLKPKVRVINADVLNAFALPGGYVYIYRGLLEKSPSFDGVMGILGHEWAHVTARHGTRGQTRAIKTMTAAIAFAAIANIAAEIKYDSDEQLLKELVQFSANAIAIGGSQLYILNKGREQELEADRIGSQYAQLAGFNPTGIAQTFRLFKELSPSSNTSLERILSTHPHHDERIDKNLLQSALFYPIAQITNDEIFTKGQYLAFDDILRQLDQEYLPSKEESTIIASAFLQLVHEQNERKILDRIAPQLEKLRAPKNN